MIVEKYGLKLTRITIDDIEMIREKRNSVTVSSNMEYREHISSAQQLKWFESINNFNNFYYLIEIDGLNIGLINDKNLNWENKTSEAGLFLWETNYYKTLIPPMASLILLELGFKILGWNKTYVKVLNKNANVISYNRKIGFIEDLSLTTLNSKYYFIDKDGFYKKTRKYIHTMNKININNILFVKLNPEDIALEIDKQIDTLIDNNKCNILIHYEKGQKIYSYSR